MRTPGFYYLNNNGETRYNLLPVRGLTITWIILSVFWGNSFDDKVTAPKRASFLFKALVRIYYGFPFCLKSVEKEEAKDTTTTPIDKKLDRAGYVQHPNFWQKGFVRCEVFADRWQVWHAKTGNPCKILSTEEDLLDTLKYFERI